MQNVLINCPKLRLLFTPDQRSQLREQGHHIHETRIITIKREHCIKKVIIKDKTNLYSYIPTKEITCEASTLLVTGHLVQEIQSYEINYVGFKEQVARGSQHFQSSTLLFCLFIYSHRIKQVYFPITQQFIVLLVNMKAKYA